MAAMKLSKALIIGLVFFLIRSVVQQTCIISTEVLVGVDGHLYCQISNATSLEKCIFIQAANGVKSKMAAMHSHQYLMWLLISKILDFQYHRQIREV